MSQDSVDVWVVNLLAERANLSAHRSLLSKAEKLRFEGFKNHKQAEYYAISRSVQKRILANYLGIDPEFIEFKKGLHGKPELSGQPWFFNISHSADRLLIAVSAFSEVGVDIELLKERGNLSFVVKRCFSSEERQYWLDLSDDNKLQFFYRFWVAKEAFVKAVGRGLALGMANCVLRLPSLNGFISVPDVYGVAEGWSLNYLNIDAAYLAAVVCKTGVSEINLCRYPN